MHTSRQEIIRDNVSYWRCKYRKPRVDFMEAANVFFLFVIEYASVSGVRECVKALI